METRRLRLLVDLARLGSMRAVAEATGSTTSTVSAQLQVLAREVRADLLEPFGRGVRLTPAGRRLVEHAVGVLSAVDAATADLDTSAVPSGTIRVAGFATAIRRSLVPALEPLSRAYPGLTVSVLEHEPSVALEMLADDRVDLALVFDYSLAPGESEPWSAVVPLWETPWGVAVPGDGVVAPGPDATSVMARHARDTWIVDSRTGTDEQVLGVLGALVGVVPRVVHRVDDLALVRDLVAAGLGSALHPLDRPAGPGVTVHPLDRPSVVLRCQAVVNRSRLAWPPVAAVLHALDDGSAEHP